MNSYLPINGKIINTHLLAEDVKHYTVELAQPLGYSSGQFVMVTSYGVGECAISITSAPRNDNIFEMAVRNVGSVTGVLFKAEEGDLIGIRGPFGKGFELENFVGKDLLLVCGGLGIVPLRSFIKPIIKRSAEFGQITIISGAQQPSLFLYGEELDQWEKKGNVLIKRLVDDTRGESWDYDEGLVTNAIPAVEIDIDNTLAVLCGPPIMYKFVILELEKKKLTSDKIYVDLERRMNCGVGVCGHCQIEDIYVCKDGPVFKYSDIKDKEGAL